MPSRALVLLVEPFYSDGHRMVAPRAVVLAEAVSRRGRLPAEAILLRVVVLAVTVATRMAVPRVVALYADVHRMVAAPTAVAGAPRMAARRAVVLAEALLRRAVAP